MFQFQLHNKIQMSSARECFIANAAAAAKCIVTAVHRRILSSALEHLKDSCCIAEGRWYSITISKSWTFLT